MGLFKKRSGMVDVVDMAKRGIVIIPKRKTSNLIPAKDGFVELGKKQPNIPTIANNSTSEFDFFGSSQSQSSNKFSTETEGYNRREVDERIEQLDNKIYKLEQRLEVIEKKIGVNQPMW